MTTTTAGPTRTRVAILGGGFSGLGMAMRLLEVGVRDFVILEKASQLGGTWRDNTYPGCACDVPSHLYSYSAEPKSDWSRIFAGQKEIQAYLCDVAERRELRPYVRFGAEVRASRWDASARRWRIETTRGDFDAQFLVTGAGPLSEPRTPELPGLDRFEGTTFHSARWRHDHALAGKRVAVLGTGSSAIQFVPHIQPEVSQLFLFQRTAPWVLPKPDREFSTLEKLALEHVPGLRRALRAGIYGGTELLQLAQRSPAVMREIQRLGLAHLRRQVRDPELRERLTPSFTLGCKRLLLSNTYYPALQKPNVELVPHGVTEITRDGVLGADGIERKVDTIIFGTGFAVTDHPGMDRVFGVDGKSMGETFRGSPEAYLGTTCRGFPNAFSLIGPNTGNGHGSAFVIIEAQVKYIADAIQTAAREGITSMDVRPAAQRAWNEDVQAALSGTVFNAGGCASYYIDANGRNSSIYPWTTLDLRWRLRRFDPGPYVIERAEGTERRVSRRSPAAIDLGSAVVAITGGARGIGLATARRFADLGAVVCIGDLDVAEARRAAATLGPRAHAFELDVSERSSFEAFVRAVEGKHGPIEVLVNNAGVMPTGRFLDEPDSVDRVAMGVNHWGTSLGMKLVLPRMIARGKGHVVNVASLAGKFEVPWMATYVASKHATVGLTGAVRHEIEGSGVTLTVVMPGAVRTRLSAGVPLEGLFAQEPDDVAKAIVESCRTRQPDVVVPSMLRAAVPVYALAPRAALRAVLRGFGADRLVAEATLRARETYERAITKGSAGSPPIVRPPTIKDAGADPVQQVLS